MAGLSGTLVKDLVAAKVRQEQIDDLDAWSQMVTAKAEACKGYELPQPIFGLSELSFSIARALPKKCATTDAVIEGLASMVLDTLNKAMDKLESCACKKGTVTSPKATTPQFPGPGGLTPAKPAAPKVVPTPAPKVIPVPPAKTTKPAKMTPMNPSPQPVGPGVRIA